MPFNVYTGDAADQEMARRAVSYEAMLSEAARSLVNQASLDLQGDIASVRSESVQAMTQMRTLVARAYLLFGAGIATFLVGVVALVLVLLRA